MVVAFEGVAHGAGTDTDLVLRSGRGASERSILAGAGTQARPALVFTGGPVERGESFAAAACRETLEESGVPIRVTGVIRVEHSPSSVAARLRVVFLAEPADDTPPKSEPDEESPGAVWVSLEDLSDYPLRGEEVRELFTHVARGGVISPPDILQPEGMPY